MTTRCNLPPTLGNLPGTRAEPPDRLRPDMREEWRKIIGRMPADWFGLESLPVLEQLCRCLCLGRDWGAYLDKVDPADTETQQTAEFKLAFSRYVRLTSLTVSLAGKLRLTTASQRDVRNSRAMMGTDNLSPNKPWSKNGGDPVTKN